MAHSFDKAIKGLPELFDAFRERSDSPAKILHNVSRMLIDFADELSHGVLVSRNLRVETVRGLPKVVVDGFETCFVLAPDARDLGKMGRELSGDRGGHVLCCR